MRVLPGKPVVSSRRGFLFEAIGQKSSAKNSQIHGLFYVALSVLSSSFYVLAEQNGLLWFFGLFWTSCSGAVMARQHGGSSRPLDMAQGFEGLGSRDYCPESQALSTLGSGETS